MGQALKSKNCLDPYSKVSSKDVMKVNQKIEALEDQLFAKDKVIQDKILMCNALQFLHEEQLKLYDQKLY